LPLFVVDGLLRRRRGLGGLFGLLGLGRGKVDLGRRGRFLGGRWRGGLRRLLGRLVRGRLRPAARRLRGFLGAGLLLVLAALPVRHLDRRRRRLGLRRLLLLLLGVDLFLLRDRLGLH